MASSSILIFIALIWTQKHSPTAFLKWLITLELIWSNARVWCWRSYLAEVTECLHVPCPALPPSLLAAEAPAGAPLQHCSLESPKTGTERMETKIRHWGQKERQEKKNWEKKEKETLACVKSTREDRKGRSWVWESKGFCEHIFISESVCQHVHLSISLWLMSPQETSHQYFSHTSLLRAKKGMETGELISSLSLHHNCMEPQTLQSQQCCPNVLGYVWISSANVSWVIESSRNWVTMHGFITLSIDLCFPPNLLKSLSGITKTAFYCLARIQPGCLSHMNSNCLELL